MGAERPGSDNGPMNAPRPSRIYSVDDAPAIRARLAYMLGCGPDVSIEGEADGAAKADLHVPALGRASVLLVLTPAGGGCMLPLNAVRPPTPEQVFVVLAALAVPGYGRAF